MRKANAASTIKKDMRWNPRCMEEKWGMEQTGMVGVRGFEPPASASRTQRSTRLSHTPHVVITAQGVLPFKQRNQGCARIMSFWRSLFLLLRFLDFRFAHFFCRCFRGRRSRVLARGRGLRHDGGAVGVGGFVDVD